MRKEPKTFILAFFLVNLLLIGLTWHHPLGDFGNYYYGSKLFFNGTDPLLFYKDIHLFNAAIKTVEPGPFFENYTPVPPFSLLFYLPLLAFTSAWAKLLFNVFGLLVLCLALYRSIKRLGQFNYWFYFLPLVFLQPLYSNYLQGQGYLLIAGLLLELFTAWQSGRKAWPGIIIALLFSLKLFPAFVAVFFLFKKDWKTLGWALVVTLVLQAATLAATSRQLLLQYYMTIVPRLAMNEITNPFSFTNQSFHSLLLKTFIFQPHYNPQPAFHSVPAAMLLQWLFYTLVAGLLIAAYKTVKPLAGFFMTLLALVLINKYSTVYGLLLLFFFMFLSKEMPPRRFALALFLLALACNIPVSRLANVPLAIQYARLWLLAGMFIFLLVWFCVTWRWQTVLICLALSLLPSLSIYRASAGQALSLYAPAGFYYDFRFSKNALLLYSCKGRKDTVETLPMKVCCVDSLHYTASGATVLKNGIPVYTSRGWVKKPVSINNNVLIFLCDEQDGAGMYHIKVIHLKNAGTGS